MKWKSNSTWTCPSLFTQLTSRSESFLNGPASQYTILIETGSSESLRAIPGYLLGGEFSHRSDLERTQRIDPSGRLFASCGGRLTRCRLRSLPCWRSATGTLRLPSTRRRLVQSFCGSLAMNMSLRDSRLTEPVFFSLTRHLLMEPKDRNRWASRR